MKIAIPTIDGVLCPHFGHCREFTFLEVDPAGKKIINVETETPPPHEPGVLPRWLHEKNCELVIVGGMGQRAVNMLSSAGVTVISGAPARKPEDLTTAYMNGNLITGVNLCDEPGFHEGGHTDCDNKHHTNK